MQPAKILIVDDDSETLAILTKLPEKDSHQTIACSTGAAAVSRGSEERFDVILADFFLRKFAQESGKTVERISPEALALLCAHTWAGNVRKLEHAIERAVILTQNPTILPQDFPPDLQGRGGISINPKAEVLPLREIERRHLLFALERAGGNRKRAAEWLGITRRTLYRMTSRHGINLTASPD